MVGWGQRRAFRGPRPAAGVADFDAVQRRGLREGQAGGGIVRAEGDQRRGFPKIPQQHDLCAALVVKQAGVELQGAAQVVGPVGRGLDHHVQRPQTAQVLRCGQHGVGNGDAAVRFGHRLAGGGHGIQGDAQGAVANGVDVGVQIGPAQGGEELAERLAGQQHGAAAAGGVGLDDGGGFSFDGAVVGNLHRVQVYQV